MSNKDQDYLRNAAFFLTMSHRYGVDVDEPEGLRWIQISDTLATDIAKELRAIADRMDAEREQAGEAQEFRDWQDEAMQT